MSDDERCHQCGRGEGRIFSDADDDELCELKTRVEKLEEALRESCEDWDKMHNASLQAAGPRLNKRMQNRIAGWKKLCGHDRVDR